MSTITPGAPGALLRINDVLQRIPVSRSALYAGMRKGLYPRPVRIGPRTVAWREKDIAEAVDGFRSAASVR